jgi:hypothetical protein
MGGHHDLLMDDTSKQRSRRRNTNMSVSQFHRAADSFGSLFMLLMGLATGGALAVVGL